MPEVGHVILDSPQVLTLGADTMLAPQDFFGTVFIHIGDWEAVRSSISILEQLAINVLQSALPNIKLSSIPAETIVKRGGAVHCITLGLNLPGTADEVDFWVKRTRNALSSDSILFN